MSGSQRAKGARGELEIVHKIHDVLGIDARRNLFQTREGGSDIHLPPYWIEVKRRKAIGNLYDWMAQAENACRAGERPLVVLRADGKQWLAVMPLDDCLPLIREELRPDLPPPK